MTRKFCLAPQARDNAHSLYFWHHGFASSNNYVTPRTRGFIRNLCDLSCVYACRRGDDEFVAVCYNELRDGVWILGGLACSLHHRNKGIGTALSALSLSNVLLNGNATENGQPVVAFVAVDNEGPRRILEASGFDIVGQGNGADHISSLEFTKDTMSEVVFDKFQLVDFSKLEFLADWFRTWNGKLRDGKPACVASGRLSLEEIADAISVIAKTSISA